MGWLRKTLEQGLKLPTAWNGKVPASERLLFSHLSFYVALWTVVTNQPQSWTAIAFFSLCTVLHMFKEVDKFSFNARERSIEIEDKNEQEKE